MNALISLALLLALPAHALDRPQLQILNASPAEIEVFWLEPTGKRVPNGKIRPGKHHLIGTTLGHRFLIVDGNLETEVESKVRVQAFRYDPTAKDGIPAFYSQVLYAQGYPICASSKVNPYALKEAATVYQQAVARLPDGSQLTGDSLEIRGTDLIATGSPVIIRGIIATLGSPSTIIRLNTSDTPSLQVSGPSQTYIVSPPALPKERKRWF